MAAVKVSVRSAVAARPAPVSRSAVVVRASAESRRAVLSGFLAGAAALTLSNSAQAATPVDLFDDRKVRDTGFDLIYEARDLDLPQNQRDGMTQARGSLEATKARVKESETRIDADLLPNIKKSYWLEARQELRRQVGMLRFDLNTLAQTKAKEEKKAALALSKEFLNEVEALDFALRQKDQATALAKLSSTESALDKVLAAVL